MTTLTGGKKPQTTLANGDKMMLASVPDDAYGFTLTSTYQNKTVYWYLDYRDSLQIPVSGHVSTGDSLKILGTYHKGEIDFVIKREWVESGGTSAGIERFRNYGGEHLHWFSSYATSFLSLLQSLTQADKKYVVLIETKIK